MSTKTEKPKKEDEGWTSDWKAHNERAPSVIRKEEPLAARVVAMFALFLALVGALSMISGLNDYRNFFGVVLGFGWGVFFLALGAAGLLFHASAEKDIQYRRLYGLLALVFLAGGVLTLILPYKGSIGGLYLPLGAPCFTLALAFLLCFARNEEDEEFLKFTHYILGVSGGLMVLLGLIGGVVSENFLLSLGIINLILGLLYWWSFIAIQPTSSDAGYFAGFVLGLVAVVMIAIGLLRVIPFADIPFIGPYLGWISGIVSFVQWSPNQAGPPLLFIILGFEFFLLSIGVCSDMNLAVMTRRELAAYFFSPIAYIVLVAITIMGMIQFSQFVGLLLRYTQFAQGMPEPIFYDYIFNIIPIFALLFMVPLVTMRLLSEEKRTGTLEVLLTAPVREWNVVLSKFIAGLRFFLLTWYSWYVFLIALRVEGQQPFDYRPILTFTIVLIVTGAHFISMGLFFSGVMKNQIGAAVLTFLGLLGLFSIYIIRRLIVPETMPELREFLLYISFLDLWFESARGVLAPRFLLFHISATVFWLFLTTKILEARKWW